MHRQPSLFDPMCAETHARQGSLFDNDGPADSALHCKVCGEYLTGTPSGYLACPKGHGKLRGRPCRSNRRGSRPGSCSGRSDLAPNGTNGRCVTAGGRSPAGRSQPERRELR